MAAPVIFLDIDGVLCTPFSFWLNRLFRLPIERQCFDPIALFWLRRLVKRTGAQLVLSSSWRNGLYIDDAWCRAITQNLYDRLARNKTPLMDATPIHDRGDKSTEITAWLEQHPHTHYIILDDNNCFALTPSVRARWIPVPEHKGLRYPVYKISLRKLLL